MKKIYFVSLCLFAFSFVSVAQKGNNEIGIGAELNVPLGQLGDAYSAGFGGSVKGLYGVGTAGQLTLTVGYSGFKGKSGTLYKDQKFSLLPVLLGYRHHFSSFYVEPQVGVTTDKTKIPGFTFSETKFTAALNVGYLIQGFDLSLRYHTEGDVLSLFAVRAGYNFPLGKKHSK
jgi:hypothetical protein